MSTGKGLSFWPLKKYILPLLYIFAIVSAEARGNPLTCEDSPFEANSRPCLLRTKYHLIQIFGNYSAHTTNFFREDYRGSVFWSEQRLSFPRFSVMINSSIPPPDPLVVGVLKGLKNINWEDRFDYGLGFEWRPLRNINFDSLPILKTLNHIRFYFLRLWTSYLQYENDWSWRPNDDTRLGLEIYRECNFYNKNRYWAELWMDFSWRETNFYVNDFESWFFAIVPKWGINLTRRSGATILPYVVSEVVVTGRREFWQNRIMLGVGLRIMPFRWQTGFLGDLFRGTKLHFEYSRILVYLKDEAPDNDPMDDIQAGFSYTINRW